MKQIRFLVLCFLFSATIAIGWAEEIISIRRSSAVLNGHSTNVSLSVRIEKSTDNRELKVECESEDFYTSTGMTLNGEDTPIEMRFEFNLPRGEFECKGILTRNTSGRKKEFANFIKFFVL